MYVRFNEKKKSKSENPPKHTKVIFNPAELDIIRP